MELIKNHKWAFVLAFVAAVIIAYPQVYFRYDHPDVYRGIEVIGASDDERNWLPRVREVQDGHPSISNAYFKDGKDDPYLFQPLGSMMVAYLGKLFSLDINNTILLSRFLFPFIVFLLLYGFVFLFTKEKLTALATSTFFFLGSSLFGRTAIFRILSNGSPKTDFLSLTRPVNPALTWFFFFGFLLCFWLFLEKKQWRYGILSALTLGLSFYDFFYTWTFLYVFCGVLGLIFLFQKKWLDFKRIIIVLLGAAIIAIPYFINLYQVTIHPNYIEVGQRFGFGLVEGRVPVLGLLVPFLLIIFLLFFPRKWKERYFFGLALVITPFIVLDQQLITGQNVSGVHYHWYFHRTLAILFLLMIFFFWQKGQFLKKLSAILIIIISIATGIFVQNSSYAAKEDKIIKVQRYGPVMDWLNENAEKEEVVFADDETARLIIIYTPLNLFYHSGAGKALAASKNRLLDILFLLYRLDGVRAEEAEEVFFKDRLEVSHFMYSMYYKFITGTYEGIPDEILLDFSQKYRDSLGMPTADFINNSFRKYEVKYLVWDKTRNPLWQLDQYPFLEKAIEIDEFVIYKFAL